MISAVLYIRRWVVAALCVAFLVVTGATTSSRAASAVLTDIQYIRDGGPDDEARRTVESYLEFLLPRLLLQRPQRIADYVRDCYAQEARRMLGEDCSPPSLLIQLQIRESDSEVRISGTIGTKLDGKGFKTSDLGGIRLKTADFTEGLAYVAKRIESIVNKGAPSVERTNVLIACIGSGYDQLTVRRKRSQRGGRIAAAAKSGLSDYESRVSMAIEALIREQPRFEVSKANVAGSDCSSLDALRRLAKSAHASAMIMARFFNDDKGGLYVSPQLFLADASRKISLSPVPSPAGGDPATSSGIVARRLAAASNALIDPPNSTNRADLIKAIEESAELPYYLRRAKEFLSSSPSQYESADALLDIAIWKDPSDQRAYLARASSLADRRRFKDAADALQMGIGRVSDPRALYVALAENTLRSGDLVGARAVYLRGLSKNVLAQEAYLGIARTYFSARPPDRDKAIEYALRAATPQNAASSEAYSFAGQVALSKDENDRVGKSNEQLAKEFEQAEMYFKESLKLSLNSVEVVSRLSNLYERWAAYELKSRGRERQIEILTKSIELSPSAKKYYDRGTAELSHFVQVGDRAKAYQLTSRDFGIASELAAKEGTLLAQFPWLLASWAEVLIFEGRFQKCKEEIQRLFFLLNTDSSIRPSVSPKDIRIIGAFLNAAAEILASGSADKEMYLLQNIKAGVNTGALPWSFGDMLRYLEKDYAKSFSELDSSDKETRAAAVKELIAGLTQK